ncbi:hypothetical protein CP533_1344 [Ophiocordyceps camponoti-saundersi (nom. inval.)]|nr:hypothetical protein CP533_1344 [Ophiocordyceps camponoti-saundersi (nom. inval.)]
MKLINHLTALLGLAGPSLASIYVAPFHERQQVGQGYNTFLGKAVLKDVILIEPRIKSIKRDVGSAGTNVTEESVEKAPIKPFTAEEIDFLSKPIDLAKYAKMVKEYRDAPEPYEPLFNSKLLDIRVNGTQVNGTISRIFRKKRQGNPYAVDGQTQEDIKCAKGGDGTMTRWTEHHTSFATYAKSTQIGAEASVSGWGASVSASAKHLSQSSFSENSLTSVSTIEIDRQLSSDDEHRWNVDMIERELVRNPRADYGDKYIIGFATGGRIRVETTIVSTSSGSSTETSASLQAAAAYFGVTGSAGASTSVSSSDLQGKVKVKTHVRFSGDLGRDIFPAATNDGSDLSVAEAEIAEAKRIIDQFLKRPCRHSLKFKALLDDYETVPGRPEGLVIPDYRNAKADAFGISEEFERITRKADLLKLKGHFTKDQTRELTWAVRRMQNAALDWLKSLIAQPHKSEETSKALIDRFNKEFHDKYQDDMHIIQIRDALARDSLFATGEVEGPWCKLSIGSTKSNNTGWYDPVAKKYTLRPGLETWDAPQPTSMVRCPLSVAKATEQVYGTSLTQVVSPTNIPYVRHSP